MPKHQISVAGMSVLHYNAVIFVLGCRNSHFLECFRSFSRSVSGARLRPSGRRLLRWLVRRRLSRRPGCRRRRWGRPSLRLRLGSLGVGTLRRVAGISTRSPNGTAVGWNSIIHILWRSLRHILMIRPLRHILMIRPLGHILVTRSLVIRPLEPPSPWWFKGC